jgi:UDP-2-acetamido-2,6-beta-L-arabino-hexul-4-ose reductase
MSTVLVTGANGFLGKNVRSILENLGHTILTFDKENTIDELEALLTKCTFVIHLAGVNRPENPKDFYKGNTELTEQVCQLLEKHGNNAPLLLSSSIQAERDNDYGKSKKEAEDVVLAHGKKMQSPVYVFRFKNLYGKWSRPNYNSVVASWCHNISRNLPIQIDNPKTELALCYVDDAVDAIVSALDGKTSPGFCEVAEVDTVTLEDLHTTLLSFRASRENLSYPDQSTAFKKKLFATYLSYLNTDDFSYSLQSKSDERGSFTEVLRDKTMGQISINIAKPGITKGQHWHSTKIEKFMVVHGSGVIRFRDVFSDKVLEYTVRADNPTVVDIPVGYVHNIQNVGTDDMVTLMWASEAFNPDKPDTNFKEV